MTRTPTESLIQQLVGAALSMPTATALLDRATELAETTRDRQLVAIAHAYLAGDRFRVDVLAREHLADFPGSLLVASIAANTQFTTERNRS